MLFPLFVSSYLRFDPGMGEANCETHVMELGRQRTILMNCTEGTLH